MKILMPYVNISGESITSNKISGGTELFSQLVHKHFDVVVVNIPWTTSTKENAEYSAKIRNIIELEKIDIILSNNIKSLCLYRLRDFGIPILHITHTNYGLLTANLILNTMIEYGHSIFGVSNYNINYMQNKAQRLNQPIPVYSGIIMPSYVMYDLDVNINPPIDAITVGRANSYKRPFIIEKHLRNTKYDAKIITSLGVDENSIEYYERNKNTPHEMDVLHPKVMEYIRDSKVMCITCKTETFGIIALEALALGVPLVIYSATKVHASAEIPVSVEHFRMIDDDSQQFVNSIDELQKVDRKEIKEMTHEKYHVDIWKSELANAFDKTIENYKMRNKPKSTLSDLFQ